MNAWLIVELVLVVLLAAAFLSRAQLAHRFQIVVMATSAVLVAVTVAESLADRMQPWTIGLGAIALILFAVEVWRQSRRPAGRME